MWLATVSGWYSVVADKQREGFVLVRARCGVDIANLYRDHHDVLGSMSEPTSDESRDYRWRLSVSREDWIKLAGRLAESVQYGNFKSAVHAEPTQSNKSSAYHRIWQEMAELQRTEQYGARVEQLQTLDRDSDMDRARTAFIAKVDAPPVDRAKSPAKRKARRKKAKKLF